MSSDLNDKESTYRNRRYLWIRLVDGLRSDCWAGTSQLLKESNEFTYAGETFKWIDADKRDCLDATFHMKKTEFSQYTEAAVRFKSQLTDKAIDTSKQKR